MPYLTIKTNCEYSDAQATDLLKQLSQMCCDILGKPEKFMAANIERCPNMIFGAESDPTAFVELRSIGIPEKTPRQLTASMSDLLMDQLLLRPDRIYFNFVDVERHLWGWNSETF